MQVQLTLDDDLAAYMRVLTGMQTTELTREALTLYHWALKEASKGRVLLSAAADGTDLAKVSLPGPEHARKS